GDLPGGNPSNPASAQASPVSAQASPVASAPGALGALTQPRSPGATQPRSPGATQPRSPGATQPRSPGAEPAADRLQGERTLQALAKLSGGRYFRAHDAPGLLQVCREIDQLEKQEIQSYQYRRYYEAYPWLGLTAL